MAAHEGEQVQKRISKYGRRSSILCKAPKTPEISAKIPETLVIQLSSFDDK